MSTYYTNEDGYIYKKDGDIVYILQWTDLEFKDIHDLYEDEEIEDPVLNEMMGIDELFDISDCIEISKQEVKKQIENHVMEITLKGKLLIKAL